MPQKVPWVDWNEWIWVYKALFKKNENTHAVYNRIETWKARQELPLAIASTHNLLTTLESGCPLSLATVIVRTVNGLVDSWQQKATFAAPVNVLAAQLGIPLFIVDLRHEISHNQMPTFPALSLAGQSLLSWLKVNYWDYQYNTLKHVVSESALCISKALSPSPSLSVEVIRSIYIPLLVNGTCFKSEFKNKSGCIINSSRAERYKPFLKELDEKWNLFGAAFFHELVNGICSEKNDGRYYWYWISYLLSSDWHIGNKKAAYCMSEVYELAGFELPEVLQRLRQSESNSHCKKLEEVISRFVEEPDGMQRGEPSLLNLEGHSVEKYCSQVYYDGGAALTSDFISVWESEYEDQRMAAVLEEADHRLLIKTDDENAKEGLSSECGDDSSSICSIENDSLSVMHQNQSLDIQIW